MLVETDDITLKSRFQNKTTKKEAFKEILDSYSRKLYYFLRKLGIDHEDTDELIQDVFLNLWRTEIFDTAIDLALYRLMARHTIVFLEKKAVVQINGLTSKELIIMILKDQEEFDFSEIAQITAIPVTEVRHYFKVAVTKFNQTLRK
ncbi:sigma-70 family RNA polymerase sigma factor [Mucilaginibacter sp. PAMB04168]|uniref:RNA polymerase sigma factor n=1 Tax=Mucilaginibacter sp. PAMB04168 TaxID=3138567 RepID=UPI0031F69E1B